MTPMDDTSSPSAGAVTPSSALKLPLESAAYHDHTMEPSEAHPQPLLPEGSPRPDSEYGDFASDEEDILSQLVETVAPSFTELIAPLLVTEIEDYEGPKGVRLPKVLGAERSDSAWVSQLRAETEEQMLRDSGSPKKSREARRGTERGQEPTTWRELQNEGKAPDTRSPLERFRKPPKKALSVTDLVSPAWCELQYFYILAKHGRKKRTPAMRQGSTIHKILEDQVHTTVAVDITTKEDSWGLRIWNIIQGLRTLRDTGITRELEVWGVIGGEIVNGIVDELSYTSPDPKLEAEIDEHYANAQSAREALPEYQTSITDYLLASAGAGGRNMANTGNGTVESMNQQEMPPPPLPGKQKPNLVYITDVKTRGIKSLPGGASIRPTVMQLHLYHHMLENLAHGNLPLELLADRYKLDTRATFSDSFTAQVGSLNQDFFETTSEHIGAAENAVMASQIASSQDSMDLLLKHNNLSSLWTFMIQQFQETFLLQPTFSAQPTPTSTPQSIHDAPSLVTRLSPILTATYLSSTTSELLGSKSILFDAALLRTYLEENLAWWRGERDAKGVELQEAWKCRTCDYRDDCSWIHERDAAAVAEAKARKKMREVAGVEARTSKSEV